MKWLVALLALMCTPAQAGQACFAHASPIAQPGTDVREIMDTAGHRPTEWMSTLPYPLVPIVRSQVTGYVGSDNVLSIDKNQTQLKIGGGPFLYQQFNFTDQPWYGNQPLAHVGGGTVQTGPYTPPLILDRRVDSVWMDVSNAGTSVSQAGWHICWDADMATQLNAGWTLTGSGWQTSAGLVVMDVQTGAGAGWDNLTIAVVIQSGVQSNRSVELINSGGSQVRVTVASGTSNTSIIGATIGPVGGPMITVTWNGGHVGTVVPASSQTTSDGVPFVFDSTKPLLFKYLTGTGVSVQYAYSIPGWAAYWRAGNDVASANYLPAAGYTASSSSVIGLIRVETLH